MNIKFYHIKGISRENTPRFTTNTDQLTYFNSKLVKVIESSYYPPHYKNTLVLDTDDVDFDTEVNYLSFNFKNKEYYYFIDSVLYLNEHSIRITITMDSIQTYFFNISVSNSIIERAHISRWNVDGTINRNYIRENVSQCEKHMVDMKMYTGNELSYNVDSPSVSDFTNGMFVLKLSSNAWRPTANEPIHISNDVVIGSQNKPYVPQACYYYFLPLFRNYKATTEYVSGSETHEVQTNGQFEALGKITTAISFMYFPFNPLKSNQIYIDSSDKIHYASEFVYVKENSTTHANWGAIAGRDNTKVTMEVRYQPYSFDFEKNNLHAVSYEAKYEPSLLDENYMSLTFGENAGVSEFPLYMLTTKDARLWYWADIASGNRYYTITGNNYTGAYASYSTEFNKYSQLKELNNIYSLDLVNDPWLQWRDANKASIGMQYVGLAMQAIGAVSVGSSSGATATSGMAEKLPIEEGGSKSLYDIPWSRVTHQSNNVSKTRSTSGSSGSGMLGVATSQYNSWLAPNNAKVCGNATGDIFSQAATVCRRLYKVDDYDKCALFYHMYGNKLMKPVSPTINPLTNIFFMKRYYFNYMKFYQCEVHIDLLEVDNICNDIADRLISGVRLWWVNRVEDDEIYLGYYGYDNFDYVQ